MATTTILQRVCFLPLLVALLNTSGCCAGKGQVFTGPVAGSGVTAHLGYRLYGWKWEQESISYKILNYPENLDNDSVREEIKKAFNLWANVTNLSFPEMVNGTADWEKKADIDIRFEGKFRPGLLAVSVHHENKGEIRFNPEYTFSTDYTGINLLQVAAHVIGHSLGLDHSENEDALMYPTYRKEEPKQLLSEDDIKGIQALYKTKTEPEEEIQGQSKEKDNDHPNINILH